MVLMVLVLALALLASSGRQFKSCKSAVVRKSNQQGVYKINVYR